MTTKLPKGIFYEASRNRYRVRLYKFGRVVFQSYHTTLPEALKSLNKNVPRRARMKPAVEELQGATVKSILLNLLPKKPDLN